MLPESQTQTPPNAGEGVKQHELSFADGGNASDTATLEDSLATSYKTLTQSNNHAPWYQSK
jgi:hypothetical protein